MINGNEMTCCVCFPVSAQCHIVSVPLKSPWAKIGSHHTAVISAVSFLPIKAALKKHFFNRGSGWAVHNVPYSHPCQRSN